VFSRTYSKGDFTDVVVVGLDLPVGEKVIHVNEIFKNGTMLRDAYSNQSVMVKNGQVEIVSDTTIVLLEL
jgi:alpha-amylase